MVRSIIADANGRVETIYNGEAPNADHDWKEIPEESYIRPSPPSGYTADTYLKSEASGQTWDEETNHLGFVYVEQSTTTQ